MPDAVGAQVGTRWDLCGDVVDLDGPASHSDKTDTWPVQVMVVSRTYLATIQLRENRRFFRLLDLAIIATATQ